MGVLCQFVQGKTVGNLSPPFPSVRMAKLFYEFLGRYKEWKMAKLQETIWMLSAAFLGLLSICIPLFFPHSWRIISFVVLILFYFTTRHYLELNERVNRSYINVQILYHHLIGKLEVGFCDHGEPCQCVENFRSYVLEYYSITLDKRLLS